ANPAVLALQLEHGEAVGHGTHPRAAVAVQRRAEQRHLAELTDELAGKRAGLVVTLDGRSDAPFAELPRRAPDQTLVVVEEWIDAEEIGRRTAGHASGLPQDRPQFAAGREGSGRLPAIAQVALQGPSCSRFAS